MEDLNVAHGLFANSPKNRGAGTGLMNNDLLSDLHEKDELASINPLNITKSKRKSKTGRSERERTPMHGGVRFDRIDERSHTQGASGKNNAISG